jgi:positive regulator of sigma E activity
VKDLQSARLIYLKAALFVVLGVLSAAMLFAQSPHATTLLLIAMTVWAFARAYYFAFYVIERYVDPSFRFSGLFAFIRYAARRRRG